MQLSRNFSLQELIKSDTAIRKGINNNPNAEQTTLNFLIGLNLTLRQTSLSSSSTLRVSLTADGFTVVGYLKVDVHRFYMLIDQKVKQNINL